MSLNAETYEGEKIVVWILKANDSMMVTNSKISFLPSKRYMNLLIDGAK